MTILHITDLHFELRWFDWLRHRPPPHDLLVISGNLLDLAASTPQRKQIAWVSDWINRYPRPLCICSGDHDLEWDATQERWRPAYWLRGLRNPNVWTDGQRVELNDLSILNLGRTTRPMGGAADLWVVHRAPSATFVATRADGSDGGDQDLGAAVRRYGPRFVLSGHVQNPAHWRECAGATGLLNPGRNAGAAIPNYILLRPERMICEFFGEIPDLAAAVPPAVVPSAGPKAADAVTVIA